jgi:hypothetical protein
MPEGLVKRDVCRLSGKLPGPRCPTKLEIFAPHTVPVDACDWHTPRGIAYPDELKAWARRAGKETGRDTKVVVATPELTAGSPQ